MSLPSFFNLYQALIAAPSISSNSALDDQSNKAVIDLLADWFSTLGFRVDVQAVPDSRDKYNLLASAGEGSGGLLLAGHTDTVAFDEGRWTRDPFTLTEQDNKLYGLGTADMKGFFAFIVDTLRNIDINKLQRPLYILATADEETSMAGARYFSSTSQIRPDLAIIGEPTSLKPVRAHKGYISNSIRITGQSGHSSDPDKGVNAIELMNEAISQLLVLRSQLKERYHNDAFAVPYPTLNLGNIRGGDSVNRICACCELQLDIRPLPGLTLNDLNELLNESLQPIKQRWPNRLTIAPLNAPIAAYECPIHSPAIQLIEKLLNERAETANYCTEAPFIQALCPTIVLGPGSIEQAHQPDEFIDIAFIKPTQDLLGRVINHFCLQD